MKDIKMRKWWWGWQYDLIEAWLEEKALEGYMLKKVTGMGEVFHFTMAEPKKIRYCVDYQINVTNEYKQILADDGWQFLNIPGNWIICWKEYENEKPELINDYDTVIERNNRLLAVSVCLMFPIYFMPKVLDSFKGIPILTVILTIFYAAIVAFYAFSIISLAAANKALRQKKELQNK